MTGSETPSVASWVVLLWSGTNHSLVRAHVVPLRTVFSIVLDCHAVFVLNVASHPALQSTTTNNNEFAASPGIMCLFLAAIGK